MARLEQPGAAAALAVPLTGSGVPSDAVGVDGQTYFDVTNGVLYAPKAAGAWPAGVDLQGPAGNGLIESVLLASQIVVDATFNPTATAYVDLTGASITRSDFDGSPVKLVLELASVSNSAAFQGGFQFWVDGAAINPGATQTLGLKSNVAATHLHTDPVAGNTGLSGAIAVATDNLAQTFALPHTPTAGTHTYKIVVRRNASANTTTLAALFGRMGEFRIERR